MSRAPRWITWTLALAFLVICTAAALAVWTIYHHGINARDQPTAIEVLLARQMRHFAIPSHARAQSSPAPATPEVVAAGLAHFADHCASCHGNDGSGDTALGRNLYPKAPDMRLPATQSLSDGELFHIIENGIRLTGMPAWGTGSADSHADTWKLVAFIRHLPALTEDELARMRTLNPKTADELQEEDETRRFLAGEDEPAKSPPSAHHH